MKRSLALVLSLIGLVGLIGAMKVTLASAPAVEKPKEIVFEKKMISLGGQKLFVEIADTEEKTARGLMFREKLPHGQGMLFIFPDEKKRHFWMKNTFIPLSIGYFDSKRRLVEIQSMEPVKSIMDQKIPSYPSKSAAQFALEVPQGWFEKHGIKKGITFEFMKAQQ